MISYDIKQASKQAWLTSHPRTHRPTPQARRPRPYRPLSHRRPGLGRQLGSHVHRAHRRDTRHHEPGRQHQQPAPRHPSRRPEFTGEGFPVKGLQRTLSHLEQPPPIVDGNTAKAALATDTCGPRAIYDSIDPPNELRNQIHLRNLALVHVALIISLMQRVAGSTVTNDRHHGARGGMYGAHEHYVQPYPVTNS